MKLQHKNSPANSAVNRRQFCATSGIAAVGLLSAGTHANAETGGPPPPTVQVQTGNGEWTYGVVPHWGQLPEGKIFGGTHGAIATDKAGLVYVSTQSATGVLVYDRSGKLLRAIATDYPEIHSMVYADESGTEYFYVTVQKGTPKENWLFLKMKTDGTVVQKIVAPPEAGFHAPNEWRLTAAIPGPDGSIFIANGYGDSRIFIFDKAGNYKASFAGKGDTDGRCNCCHGLTVDMRYDQPLLMVCDRENRRLSHYDFDGKFVSNTTLHLRRPCQVSFHGEYAVVSELEGRVTVLDKNNAPVAFLGDNPHKDQWANYKLPPSDIAPAWFSAAHGCHIDQDANIYVSDWNQSGRVSKLTRVIA
jgi:6-bladed beta-propeller